MKVEGPNPLRAGSVRRKSTTSADGSFADALGGDDTSASAPAGLSGPQASASVNTILALQAAEAEEGDAAAGRSKQRAEMLLRQLEMLKMDILAGAIRRDHLEALAQSVRTTREQVIDPRLTEVLDEIDLRAQVELAKYSL